MRANLMVVDFPIAEYRLPIEIQIMNLRGANPVVLRTRFSELPWTSFLLCVPKHTILGMHQQLISATHARWLTALNKPEQICAAFVKEHEKNGLRLSDVPTGLYAYGSSDAAEPPRSRIGQEVHPLEPLWFESFLIPQTDEAERLMLERISRAIAELDWFFIRPFKEDLVPLQGLPYRDALDLGHVLFDASIERSNEISALLESTILSLEAGTVLEKDKLIAATTYFCRCTFPIYSNRGEIVSSLRARLIRLLGWPMFYKFAVKGLLEARKQYGNSARAKGLPFDTVRELEEYLEHCRGAYPILIEDPFEHLWKSGRMPTGKHISSSRVSFEE